MTRRLLMLVAVVPMVTAIDCYHTFAARAAVTPAPSSECVGHALSAMRQVVAFRLEKGIGGTAAWTVVLDDSTAKRHRREVFLVHRTAPAPHDTLRIGTSWALLASQSAAEKQALTSLSASVLTELQARCATATPAFVTCELDQHAVPCFGPS